MCSTTAQEEAFPMTTPTGPLSRDSLLLLLLTVVVSEERSRRPTEVLEVPPSSLVVHSMYVVKQQEKRRASQTRRRLYVHTIPYGFMPPISNYRSRTYMKYTSTNHQKSHT